MEKPAPIDMKIHPLKLSEYFTLDCQSGILTWNKKVAKKIVVGSVAGSARKDGYSYVTIFGEKYGIHQVVYAMTHGRWANEIDHIDGNPSNNKPENLRECTRSQNNINRSVQVNNTSGRRGVYLSKRLNLWHARIKINGRYISLKYHKTIEAAHDAYEAAAKIYHGEFVRVTP